MSEATQCRWRTRSYSKPFKILCEVEAWCMECSMFLSQSSQTHHISYILLYLFWKILYCSRIVHILVTNCNHHFQALNTFFCGCDAQYQLISNNLYLLIPRWFFTWWWLNIDTHEANGLVDLAPNFFHKFDCMSTSQRSTCCSVWFSVDQVPIAPSSFFTFLPSFAKHAVTPSIWSDCNVRPASRVKIFLIWQHWDWLEIWSVESEAGAYWPLPELVWDDSPSEKIFGKYEVIYFLHLSIDHIY